jgi:caspase domain-containing protein
MEEFNFGLSQHTVMEHTKKFPYQQSEKTYFLNRHEQNLYITFFLRSNMSNSNSNLYALLIGVDHYFPNTLPGNSYYPSLGGCVRDIGYVENFLLNNLKMNKENIIKLTSSLDNTTGRTVESPEKLPSYNNIKNAFNDIINKVHEGDQVYIHYSGHGGRTKTSIPNVKGRDGLDETLVPTDIGNSEARYIRDTELAFILKKLVDKKIIVTTCFDCCHSGGATRGNGGAVKRGTDIIDDTQRPQDSLIASTKELEDTWKSQDNKDSKSGTRDVNQGGDISANMNGYVFLAACRPSESAYEYPFEGRESNGALTYWMLKFLSNMHPQLTYKQLHDYIVAKIHTQFPEQTPMLLGAGDRKIFGSDRLKTVYAANVMNVDNNEITLNTGQVHGMRKGAKYAIYPSDVSDFSKTETRLAIVEIFELGSTNSKAKITTDFKKGKIEVGSQGVLIDPVNIRLKKRVNLVYSPELRNNELEHREEKIREGKAALDLIQKMIIEKSESFLELISSDDTTADFQVSFNNDAEYEIWDPAGTSLPNINPPLKIHDGNSARNLIQRLEHLSRYKNIQLIDNQDPASPLSGKLIVELFALPEDHDLADGYDDKYLKPLDFRDNIKTAKTGQKMVMRIRNNSNQVLNVSALNLQPRYGVVQIYPSEPFENFVPIDPGKMEFIPLTAGLPEGYKEGKDIIKVFATIDQTNFRMLELPSLDQPKTTREATRGNISSPLEELMANIAKDKPATRNLDVSSAPSRGWTTAQIELNILR